MDNENAQLGFPEEPTQADPESSPRDIIAERLAARGQKQPDQPKPEPIHMVVTKKQDSPKDEPIDQGEKPASPVEPPVTKVIELSPILAANTAEAEVTSPVVSSDRLPRERREREDRPRPERGDRDKRNKDRRPEGDRSPRALKSEADPKPSLPVQPQRPDRDRRPERAERPERPEKSERPERNERPERREERRDAKPMVKTAETAFVRAKSMASKTGVSVVIPLFNEQDSLRELTAAVREELFKLCEKKYEIIFVNDGSTDRSKEILKDISAASSRNIVIHFRSNLGKSAALSVGFKEAQYGIVITMDADLQDDPREFVNLIAKLDEGFDLVTGWKKKRNDPIGKTAPSKLFNSVTSFFSGLKLHDFNCGLKAYRKAVTDSLDVYGEMHRYLPALAHWQGFRVAEIPVMHHPRKFGKSKFGTSRFFKGFLDLLTIIFTNRYGRRPLHLFGTVGTLLTIIGFGINIYVSVEWMRGLTTLSNRPILLLGILLILVGVQLISIGLLGEMMVKSSARSSVIPFTKERRAPRTRPDRPERRS